MAWIDRKVYGNLGYEYIAIPSPTCTDEKMCKKPGKNMSFTNWTHAP